MVFAADIGCIVLIALQQITTVVVITGNGEEFYLKSHPDSLVKYRRVTS